jgi:hypothetical protein
MNEATKKRLATLKKASEKHAKMVEALRALEEEILALQEPEAMEEAMEKDEDGQIDEASWKRVEDKMDGYRVDYIF